MTMYATLEEAIDAAREEFLADNPGIDAEDANAKGSSGFSFFPGSQIFHTTVV